MSSAPISIHRVRLKRYCAAALAVLLLLCFLPRQAWPQQGSSDPALQTIEDLMNTQVSSVSKTDESLSRTAAAVFVISQTDISRSGAVNIPDLLRMVPGVDVAQINTNAFAVSVRGFNARFSNELLVLIDGRPVYTETFGGVFWDVLDMPLEDIERIEVIRGPGGSIWGSNAVNGVINIITKNSSDTHGASVVAGGGNIDQGFGTVQYGGKARSTDYRVYTKYLDQDHMPNSAGEDGGDGWHMLQGGFRADTAASSKDTLMFEGNIYSAREGTPATNFPTITTGQRQNIEVLANLTGGFVQGVWSHTFSPHSDTTLRVSYDNYQRNDLLRQGGNSTNLDFQDHIGGFARQNIVWGLTYDYSRSHSDGDLVVSLNPPNLNTQLFGSFVQDEIAIIPDRLFITLGAKLEHNYYTGFNFMPSARLAWAPTSHHTLWAAISKAERTPSAVDASIVSDVNEFPGPGGIPAVVTITGNPRVQNENLLAYEMGYRTIVRKQVSVDFTAYYNDYTDQYTAEPMAPFPSDAPAPPHLVFPIVFENLMHGETHGAEVAVNWQPTRRWTLSPGYAFEEIHMHLAPTSNDTTSIDLTEGSSPDHSAQLRSHLLLGHGLSWDTSAYFVDRLRNPDEPSYTRLDSQLTWAFRERASISLVGQNLVRNLHEEFVDSEGSAKTTEVKRSVYAKFAWRF